MCEHCIKNEELPEITQEDIDYWRQNGKYFGYPQCCIDSFCNKSKENQFYISPEQEKAVDNHGFIPCQEHAVMILEGNITLGELIKDRKCKHEYPLDDSDFPPPAKRRRNKKDRNKTILKTVIDKMFEMAGHPLKFEDVEGRTDNWFQQYTMTKIQNEEWRAWCINYLNKVEKFNKKKAGLEISMIDMYCGLKVIDYFD